MISAFCPYPGSCEYDDYKRLGVHYCARVECPYELQAKKLLLVEIHRLEALEKLTLRELHWLQRLRREYGDDTVPRPIESKKARENLV